MDTLNKDFRFKNDNHFFTIFVFPFKYFRQGNKDAVSPAEVANDFLKDDGKVWEEKPFKVSDALEYNEWHYFYPFVRSMLFHGEQDKKEGIRYLRRKDYDELHGAELLVQFYGSDEQIHSVKTDVNSVDLHLFDNQIGLLSITTECGNTRCSMEDFLRYNDTARRVYPPFLPKNSENIPDALGKTDAAQKKHLLPYTIALLTPDRAPIEERFPDLQLSSQRLYLSRIIRELLSPMKFNDKTTESTGKYMYDSFTDDRMFIVSYYRNDALGNSLSKYCCGEYEYEHSDEWYSMIFVDGSPTIANNRMKRELIRAHTYDRWADYGTLYGMSRYSFVALCRNTDEKTTDFPRRVLPVHMKTMYYQMALIVLFQRAMLINFSQRIKDLTKYFKQGEKLNPNLREKADLLHGNFIKFTNEYWFTEVTPQEQGIEMYNQCTELLELDYLYGKVKGEIAELATHVRTLIEHGTNQKIALITKMGLPLSVVIAAGTIWLAVYGERSVPDFLFSFAHLHVNPWQELLGAVYAIFGIIFIVQIAIYLVQGTLSVARRIKKILHLR
jgi:hypothetical protein